MIMRNFHTNLSFLKFYTIIIIRLIFFPVILLLSPSLLSVRVTYTCLAAGFCKLTSNSDVTGTAWVSVESAGAWLPDPDRDLAEGVGFSVERMCLL